MTFNFYETKFGKEMLGEPVDVNKEWDVSEIPRPKYSKDDKVLVFDADILSYRVSASCDNRYIDVFNLDGKKKKFKNRKELNSWAKNNSVDISNFKIEDIVESEPLSYCLNTLKRAINVALKNSGCNKFELYVEGSSNFRQKLPLHEKYKNRDTTYRPTHLKACKGLIVQHLGGYRVGGTETDEFVQTRMYELHKSGIHAITYNIDKDFLQEWRYDPLVYSPITCEVTQYKGGIGEMWLTNNGVKGSGMIWLLQQCLIGDCSDTYSPKIFFNRKYGEKSFYNDFKDVTDYKELFSKYMGLWESLVDDTIEYTDIFGVKQKKTRLEIIELYFSVAYMRISANDKTTFKSLLEEYGGDT